MSRCKSSIKVIGSRSRSYEPN